MENPVLVPEMGLLLHLFSHAREIAMEISAASSLKITEKTIKLLAATAATRKAVGEDHLASRSLCGAPHLIKKFGVVLMSVSFEKLELGTFLPGIDKKMRSSLKFSHFKHGDGMCSYVPVALEGQQTGAEFIYVHGIKSTVSGMATADLGCLTVTYIRFLEYVSSFVNASVGKVTDYYPSGALPNGTTESVNTDF